MKDLDVITITSVGQSTLPKWWRDASGLSKGGLAEVRRAGDGRNSIILTPKPVSKRGAIGLLKQFGRVPRVVQAPRRHRLPFR
jgi:bifunctional DNA-binding transcriptional regulator/antitoxin component of YhaV-PrlF toxin-antitoxin module